MESLIPVFNKIQDVFSITGATGLEVLHFPQIVVVGSQSSGKSSVLESLVGRSFLPKGTGVATRCPIVLQLIHKPADEGEGNEQNGDHCVFLHSPDEVFTDFEAVGEEIENQTALIAGTNKGIVADSISLKIYSKNVLNLTLVDLPGLVKNPVGDQPVDIEDQIKDLVMTYIKNPNSIILAVSPANMDIATSESLKYAKQVDPDGLRTLAVITKLDMMAEGTTALDVLTGDVLPVKLGIIGVVNRSQQDIVDKKPFSEKIKEEAVFLAKKYPTLASQNGVPYLGKRLNRLLMDHICTCLPTVEARMKTLEKENKAILKMWKEDKCQLNERLMNILAEFSKIYCGAIIGKSGRVFTEKIAGGARINAAFKEKLNSDVNDVKPNDDIKDETIICAIKNSKGIQEKLFVPEEAFEILVKSQIFRLQEPALDCASNVAKSLNEIINDCFADQNFKPYMERYTVLKNSISSVVRSVVAKGLVKGETILKTYVEIKAGHICTSRQEFYDKIRKIMVDDRSEPKGDDDDFSDPEEGIEEGIEGNDFGWGRRHYPAFQNAVFKEQVSKQIKAKQTKPDSKARVKASKLNNVLDKKVWGGIVNQSKQVMSDDDQCRIVRYIMDIYFGIVVEDFKDFVPQALVQVMIKPLTENLHNILISKLYDNKDKLMQESETVAIQIKTASNMIKALTKAAQLVVEVRETNF